MESRNIEMDARCLTVDEFMSLDVSGHEFSERYQQRKEALLDWIEHDDGWAGGHESWFAHVVQSFWGNLRFPKAIAATVVALCLAVPVGAYAVVSHADFFDGAFGTGWRTSQQAQQGVQSIDDKPPVNIVYPASDIVPVDQELAEALLAGSMSDESVNVTSPDGHELTISNAVRSEYAMVYQFTLHRDGGVTALEWNDTTNNVAAKGAFMPHDQQFGWHALGDDFLYVDPTQSTEDTLVGYGYTVWGEALPTGENPQVVVYTWDVPANASEEDQLHMQMLEIPCATAIESRTFANADGGLVKVSPLGLALDNETGLFETYVDGYNMGNDLVFTRSITLNMADGSTYVVRDSENDLDNTLSACGFGSKDKSAPTMFNMAFNRLVDPAEVVSVEVVVADASGQKAMSSWLAKSRDGEWPTKTVTYQVV